MKIRLCTAVLASLLAGLVPAQRRSTSYVGGQPKLLLVVVVDQLRADYLARFGTRFLPARIADGSPGGFAYLIENGAYYPFARHAALQTMTGPGHATILTGAWPARTRIANNNWYDAAAGRLVYCVGDPDSPLVAPRPTKGAGRSPRNLRGTTIGDELHAAGYPSKVVSIAIKDRAAILLGGQHADLALWFDGSAFGWVSSRHYLPDGQLPDWVRKLDDELWPQRQQTVEWAAASDLTGYSDPSSVTDYPYPLLQKIGRSFPHRGVGPVVVEMPYGMSITVDAARRALRAMALGKGVRTDVLAVGLSSFDYIGHAFGPDSVEMEEMTVATDRAISDLLGAVEHHMGSLDDVAIVLTADHGVGPVAEWAETRGIPAGRLDLAGAIAGELEARLDARFGPLAGGAHWIGRYYGYGYYLDRKAIAARGDLSLEGVEDAVREVLLTVPGIAEVFTSGDYRRRRFPADPMLEQQVRHGYVPGRSGDVVVIADPFWVDTKYVATHGSSYAYDATVPLLFAGRHFRHGEYSQAAEIVDIAPTLARILGTVPPALCEGRVLAEILK